MAIDYAFRSREDYEAEQRYLTERMMQVEKGMGRVAAKLGEPTPITSQLDTLDRSRELVADMYKQVTVRSLEDAIAAQLDWLDRAEARQAAEGGEPKTDMNRIPVDRAILEEIRDGWRAQVEAEASA